MATYADAQRIVATLPGGEEVMVAEWGHPTFRVNNKMVASRPETFAVARYVGRFGWVEVQLSNVDEAELRELLADAWRRTAPKKLIRDLDA